MTEQLLGIVGLDDLTKIRVQCLNCKTVFEVQMNKAGKLFDRGKCQCGATIFTTEDSPFSDLYAALQNIHDNKAVAVEFVVPKNQTP